MCGELLGTDKTWEELREILGGFTKTPYAAKGRNAEGKRLRPTETYPIIRADLAGGYEVIDARWWFVPSFHTGDLKEWKATTFNARIEDAPTKPTFRASWKRKRALVPATSFFEKGRCISRADNQPLVLAGLWDEAHTLDGDITSFTVLTRPAGPEVSHFHPREAVPLAVDQLEAWLRAADLPDLVEPSPSGLFRVTYEPPAKKLPPQLDLFG